MIIPDLNLLLYATNEQESRHAQAHRWWSDVLSGQVPVGLPWMVMLGFVRLVTGTRYPSAPASIEQATGVVRQWRAADCVRVIEPKDEHLHIVERLVSLRGVAGPHVMDAHLGALAIEYRGTVYSTDSDFSRFAGVSWVNPLD